MKKRLAETFGGGRKLFAAIVIIATAAVVVILTIEWSVYRPPERAAPRSPAAANGEPDEAPRAPGARDDIPENGDDGGDAVSDSKPSKPHITISGRNFLVRGEDEALGYGLYSYLLLPTKDMNSRARYVAALKAIQEQIDPTAEVEAEGYKKSEINVTYIPVGQKIPNEADLDWLVDHHDRPVAKRILGYVIEDPGPGPYLVSYLAPLGVPPPADAQILVQDLGWVPPNVIPLWIEQFRRDVRRPRYWDKEHLGSFMLRMRTSVAVIAEPIGMGAEAAERFVVLRRAIGGNK